MKRELKLLKTENVEPNEIQNKYLKLILFHKDYLDKNTNYFYLRQRVIRIHFCIIFIQVSSHHFIQFYTCIPIFSNLFSMTFIPIFRNKCLRNTCHWE